MGLLERLRSPGSKAVRDAGPRERWVIVAFLGGGIVDAMLAASRTPVPSFFYFVPPFLLTLMVSVADRNAWLIRSALASIALEQRALSAARGLPTTPTEATRWLEHPPIDATDFERAGVLFNAGRVDEARALLAGLSPTGPLEQVRLLRLRQAVASVADPSIPVDLDAVVAAVRELPPHERRRQVLSAAWTRAFVDIKARRPWVPAFLKVARQFGPYPLPGRVQIAIAAQQLSAPIACVIAGAIVLIVASLWR